MQKRRSRNLLPFKVCVFHSWGHEWAVRYNCSMINGLNLFQFRSIHTQTEAHIHFRRYQTFITKWKKTREKTHHRRQYNGSNLAAAGNCLRPVWFNVNSTCMTGENNHRFFLIHELLCISKRNRSWGVLSVSLSHTQPLTVVDRWNTDRRLRFKREKKDFRHNRSKHRKHKSA